MHNPALTIGLSMVLGMLAQVGSKHLHLPGIVLLLLFGILFGPDGLNWIDPNSIGSGLHILVGFAVAIILFEGGMNLRISRILRERRAIRGLIIKGALVTLIGGTFITIVILGWDFRTSILFGTLIIVGAVGSIETDQWLKGGVMALLGVTMFILSIYAQEGSKD